MDSSASLQRKAQIIKTAQTLFRKKGFSATSMRDLATIIGVEPASLYNHISSKKEILANICFDVSDRLFNSVLPINESALAPDTKLKKAIIAHVEVIKNNPDGFAVFINDWRYLNDLDLAKYKVLRKKYEQIFREMLIAGVERGTYKELDIKLTILTLFSSLNWIYHWFKSTEKIAPKDIGESLSHLIINGLKP